MFAFVNGPLVWIAFIVLVVGGFWQVAAVISRSRRMDKVFYDHANAGAAITSIVAWLFPFGSRSWREHPGIMTLTFVFHICLIVTPLFALGHVVTLAHDQGIAWPSLPDPVVDKMTLVFLGAAALLLIRRLVLPEVRIVTGCVEYIMWLITLLPFLTGYLAAHKMLLDPDTMLMVHVATGCLMLILIPFTKLAHAILFFLTRAFIGSEFARRGTKTW